MSGWHSWICVIYEKPRLCHVINNRKCVEQHLKVASRLQVLSVLLVSFIMVKYKLKCETFSDVNIFHNQI